MSHLDHPNTPKVSISHRFCKLFRTSAHLAFWSFTDRPARANMLNFVTFTRYTFFEWKPTILFNFDVSRDLSETENLNIMWVLNGFLHTLKSSGWRSSAAGGNARLSNCSLLLQNPDEIQNYVLQDLSLRAKMSILVSGFQWFFAHLEILHMDGFHRCWICWRSIFRKRY